MSQILRIILISGTDDEPFRHCDTVAMMLEEKGLTSERRSLDLANNPVHRQLYDRAIRQGDLPTLLICTEDESGNLKLEGAGVWTMAVLRLAAREEALHTSTQKDLIDA